MKNKGKNSIIVFLLVIPCLVGLSFVFWKIWNTKTQTPPITKNNYQIEENKPSETDEVREFTINSRYPNNIKLNTYKNSYGYSIQYLPNLLDDNYLKNLCGWKPASDGFFGEDSDPQNLNNSNDNSFRLITDCDRNYIDIFVITENRENFVNLAKLQKVNFKDKEAYMSKEGERNVIYLEHSKNLIRIMYTENSSVLNILNSIEFID